MYHTGTNFQDRRIASPPYHYSRRENHPAVLANKIQTSYDDDGTTSTTRTNTLSRMNAPAASSYSSSDNCHTDHTVMRGMLSPDMKASVVFTTGATLAPATARRGLAEIDQASSAPPLICTDAGAVPE